jgi:hypothetical protein
MLLFIYTLKKALLRRGKASLEMGEPSKALQGTWENYD